MKFDIDGGSTLEIKRDGKTIRSKHTYDAQPVLDEVAELRNSHEPGKSHWRHVASVDTRTIDHLCKLKGVRPDDPDAVRDMLKTALMDGTLAKYRVWEGTF